MTPFAIIYLSLGLVTLFWPLATLLFKRNVLGAQWLLMIALTVMSFSVIVYSTFFNNFLKGEFLLVILLISRIKASIKAIKMRMDATSFLLILIFFAPLFLSFCHAIIRCRITWSSAPQPLAA